MGSIFQEKTHNRAETYVVNKSSHYYTKKKEVIKVNSNSHFH